uniref:Uncharacterized protein n=1 Tax=Arundo donax TaxID=35708 RepID=A0A0A8XSF0_ARUDO
MIIGSRPFPFFEVIGSLTEGMPPRKAGAPFLHSCTYDHHTVLVFCSTQTLHRCLSN